MKEIIYKGICKCGEKIKMTCGLDVSFKSNVELWCRKCGEKFKAQEYDEAIYENDKLISIKEI